ncbi:hypothetical protein [Microbacterium sp. RURRCA19A]|uniref:DUF7882 family protein n=1 Tax=Microbacterium sp. RURRCA19A TaxID=1907391 RepID=UPI000953F9D0|nr:hypothetical protein [Microbacterium sp. RURRCA19A]SIR77354.1 hypothetical protein SAMN05880568_1402 [Microbacterium sp. RURRCA19A]
MGLLFYGSSERPIRIPDRVLAHVKVVIATKLRRGESFTMSWRHAEGEEGGRSTIWIQPSIPLRFVFGAVEPEMLDPALLQSYANSANSSSGLTIDLDTAVPVDAGEPARRTA